MPGEFEAQKPAPPKHSPECLLGFGFASPQFADYDSRWFMPPIGHIPSPAATSEQVRKSRFLSLGRGKLSPHRLRLRREHLAAADARKAEQAEQAFLAIGTALGAPLPPADLPLAWWGQHSAGP